MADFKVKVETTHDDKGTKEAQSALGKLAGSLSAGWAAVTAAVTVATAAIFGAKRAVDEFAEAETRFASLAQAVANQGELSRAYADELQNLAARMQQATAIADDRWLAVLEKLTKHGANPESIQRYTQAVANLAGLMGGDIESAASVFSRAMEGSFEMLGRFGLKVRENGTDLEKLEDLMRLAAERGGGILEARTRTLNGQIELASLAWADLKESIGAVISASGVLQYTLNLMALTIRAVNAFLPEFGVSLDGINNRFRGTETGAEAAAEGVHKLSDAYSKAAKSAKEFQESEDAFEDDETALKLANVDYREASKVITPADARRQRAGIRLASNRSKAERAGKGLDEREAAIRAERKAVADEAAEAEDEYLSKASFRDALVDMAVQLGVPVAHLRKDPKRTEEAIQGEIWQATWGDGSYGSSDWERVKKLQSITGLPAAIQAANTADRAMINATGKEKQIDTKYSPEQAAIEAERQRLSMGLQRNRLEQATELFRVENTQGEKPLEARLLELLKENGRQHSAWRTELIQEYQAQNRELRELKQRMKNDINR